MTVIRIGTDPELWFVDKAGKFVPANGIVPGTKERPFPLKKGAVQVDGVACEFNIDAASSAEEFNTNIVTVLDQIKEIVRNHNKELEFKFTPVATFDKPVWDKVPDDAKVLGCNPDFNVEGMVNPNPMDILEGSTLRTAAGHIHIGFLDNLIDNPEEDEHFSDCLYFAKGFHAARLTTYIPTTPIERQRLNYYGSNGAFRPKKYGVELRSPSNMWVSTEEGRKAAFTQTRNQFREMTGL